MWPCSPGPFHKPVSFKVLIDITNNSTCIGDYDEFVGYFRDRYSRLGGMIRSRISVRPIESVKKRNFRPSGNGEKNEISILGMVSDMRVTTNGHRIIEIEDLTGSITVLIKKDSDLFGTPLLLDEVVGITGTTKDGGLFIASAIIYPDVPHTNEPRRAERAVGRRAHLRRATSEATRSSRTSS